MYKKTKFSPTLLLTTALFLLAAGFWYLLFPHLLLARESCQLFLWNGDYLLERLCVPGGAAQYVAEGFVQFFIQPLYGALIEALLLVAVQLMALKLLEPVSKKALWLSLLPAFGLWALGCLPHVSLTLTVAIVLVLAVLMLLRAMPHHKFATSLLLLPAMYWLTGPAALLLGLAALRRSWVHVVLTTACMVGSQWLTPYPLSQIAMGIDYFWDAEKDLGSGEEMRCDMLMRTERWEAVSEGFTSPESPAVSSARVLADYHLGRISKEQLFSKAMVPAGVKGFGPSVFQVDNVLLHTYFGSQASAFMVSDMAYQMGLVNVAQRVAFEAMEFVPNHNKSGRALKRLAETSLISGEYALARKYLELLSQTTFYRPWAKRMLPLVDDPKRIKDYPFYEKAQKGYSEVTDQDKFFI